MVGDANLGIDRYECPVINVSNIPIVLYMDRLFNILPGNVTSETGSYLVKLGYSDFHRFSKTHVTKNQPLNRMVFLHGDWLTMTSYIDVAACCFSRVWCPDHQASVSQKQKSQSIIS